MRIEGFTKSGSSSENQSSLADLRSILANIEEHLVDKGSLPRRDDVGTAKTLEDYIQLAISSRRTPAERTYIEEYR